jgi:hypothetical protein
LTGLFIDLTDIYICIDIMNMNWMNLYIMDWKVTRNLKFRHIDIAESGDKHNKSYQIKSAHRKEIRGVN